MIESYQNLRQIADEYALADAAPLPGLPYSKVSACEWTDFQTIPPTAEERAAMFSVSDHLNIALLCGTPSKNLFGVDCETRRSFEDTLEQLDRFGIADSWIDETPRGGRIWLRSPVPLQSQKGKDIEILGQKKYGLTFPSRFGTAQYRRINHPQSILEIPSLEVLHQALPWFTPTEATIVAPDKRIPRKAKRLLRGKGVTAYRS